MLSLSLTSGPQGDDVPLMDGTETLSTDVRKRIVSRRVELKCLLTYCRSSLFSLSPKMKVERYSGRLQVIS